MTLSAPPEHTLRAPSARPGEQPSRRVARIAGIFMVITFISIPALPLYDQVLHHTNFVVGAGGSEDASNFPSQSLALNWSSEALRIQCRQGERAFGDLIFNSALATAERFV